VLDEATGFHVLSNARQRIIMSERLFNESLSSNSQEWFEHVIIEAPDGAIRIVASG